MTVVHANVYNPCNSIFFKAKANDRAQCQTIDCTNSECPLLARKQCYMRGGLAPNRCPYGTYRCESGPTKRSVKFYTWIREQQEKYKGVPFLDIPPSKMEFVGDYVLLPYSHMTMCKDVPFKSHGGFICNGDAFLPKEHWTLKTVISLITARPQALFGGEISSYQKEVVPQFLLHLRECDKDMWAQLIAVMPALDVTANHVGRKAILSTLRSPIEWVESADKYPVRWRWDGEWLHTESMNAFSGTWGNVKVKSVEIKAKPADRADVVIQSNDWVVDGTEFVT